MWVWVWRLVIYGEELNFVGSPRRKIRPQRRPWLPFPLPLPLPLPLHFPSPLLFPSRGLSISPSASACLSHSPHAQIRTHAHNHLRQQHYCTLRYMFCSVGREYGLARLNCKQFSRSCDDEREQPQGMPSDTARRHSPSSATQVNFK